MREKGVYLVRYKIPNSLLVEVKGKQVPMEEFTQNYEPVQVTNLTHVDHGGGELTVVGLIIAVDNEPEEIEVAL